MKEGHSLSEHLTFFGVCVCMFLVLNIGRIKQESVVFIGLFRY